MTFSNVGWIFFCSFFGGIQDTNQFFPNHLTFNFTNYKNFDGFLVDLKTPKGHFKINWSLTCRKKANKISWKQNWWFRNLKNMWWTWPVLTSVKTQYRSVTSKICLHLVFIFDMSARICINCWSPSIWVVSDLAKINDTRLMCKSCHLDRSYNFKIGVKHWYVYFLFGFFDWLKRRTNYSANFLLKSPNLFYIL